jgi:ribonuclease HI
MSGPTEPFSGTTIGSRNAVTPSITKTSPSTDHELDQHRELARSQGFTVTSGPSGSLVVYTDGSSRGNGQRGATAGSGIWWADKGHAKTMSVSSQSASEKLPHFMVYHRNLAERLPGQLQTNNRAELLAIIRALETCPFPQLPLEIRTDSQYSIACMSII